ncbi:MAG: alpha-hydroxy-acid oxidizing protein [bacterium]|nr:alpha-hydroxy-acid oxidizing protein [bacterium]
MDEKRRTGSSDVITRAYLDSLLLEVRHMNAVLPDTKLTLYGREFSTPVATAALSHLERVRKNGMAEMAGGAFAAGAIAFSGMGPKEELEAMTATGASVIKIIKPYEDRECIYDKIRHAENCGALAVGIDIDHAFHWQGGYDVIDGMAMRPLQSAELRDMVRATRLPFVIKGVLSCQDAVECMECGVQGIVVSHHNGRLDYSVPPLMVLPKIREATKGKIPLFVDCSLQSGLDAFKALALGATACCIGRPLMKKLGEEGADGVRRVLEDVTRELAYAMAMTCTPDLQHMDATVVHLGSFSW